MIKRNLKLILIVYAIPIASYAQPRHSSGIGMWGAEYGINNRSYNVSLAYERYFTDKFGIKGRFEYSDVGFRITNCYSFGLTPELTYTLLSNYKNLYLNSKTGAILGCETLENEVFPKRTNLFYGESIGISLEMFLNYQFKLDISLEQRFIQKSLISDYNPKLSIGVYYLLN